jgi:hypothetical protein
MLLGPWLEDTGGFVAQKEQEQMRLGLEKTGEYDLAKAKTKEDLIQIGLRLDDRPPELGGDSVVLWNAAECLKVRTRDGGIGKLIANEVQREFERKRGLRNIVLKARQMGLTTWVAARFFLRTITHEGMLTLQVAHTQQAAEEIFRIVHRIYAWLPESLRLGLLKTSRANVRQLVFPALDAQYRVESAADRNAGRGLTAQNLHCSELARWPGDPAETLAGLRATLAPDAEMVLESTPNGVGGCFHDEWQRAAETGLVRHFFPWWREPRYAKEPADPATYTAEERILAEREGLTREQIGFRREMRANFGKLARQEYAEDADSCFSMSGDCYFEGEVLERGGKAAIAALETGENGMLESWLRPVEGRQYLVAVDPASGGSGGDYAVMEVLDLANGMQCAEFAGHISQLEQARTAAALAERYNHAEVVVERNNHGHGVLAFLRSDCGYERLYEYDGQVGWPTTARNKMDMIAHLAAVLHKAPENIPSAKFWKECRTFVRQPNASVGAMVGTHDDRVMAMAIGLAVRKERLGGRK